VLYSKGSLKIFWVEVVCCANHILSKVPTKDFFQVTPKTKCSGRRQNIINLRVFGSQSWWHVPDEKWKKLEPKTHQCIFIGYSEDSKAYTLSNPSKQDVIIW
jgi:hypothetical protein